MLIIAEGVDGSGKSTFVRLLERELGGRVDTLRRGQPKRHPLQEYELDIDSYVPGSGRNVVCDRWHYGEEIYGPLYRGHTQLGLAGFRHVELYLRARGAMTVVFNPPYQQVVESLRERGETFLQSQDVSFVQGEYVATYRRALSDAHLVEHYATDIELKSGILQAQLLEEAAAPLARYRSLIGSPRPKYLLLGERRGPGNEHNHKSAFVPYPSTSGRYLLENLPDEFLKDCAIANACEEDVHQLWLDLGHPWVLPLGRDAEKECEIEELPYSHNIPHPQFVRRFHHRHGEKYGDWIRQCAYLERDMPAVEVAFA